MPSSNASYPPLKPPTETPNLNPRRTSTPSHRPVCYNTSTTQAKAVAGLLMLRFVEIP